MGLWSKLRAYTRVMRGRRGQGAPEPLALLRGRPALALGVGAMETAQLLSSRVAPRLKALAQLKTSALVGCPF